jgi:predicted 3-demethylubiquinone-9 3-methyltransferase (glyoxalase superfamily)
MATVTQKITPFLTFDTQAEEAAKFYVSVFPNSKITQVLRYGDAAPMPKGSVMVVDFDLGGQRFTALNAGPMFQFTGAVSFLVECDDQAEVDHYWDRLTDGGRPIQCGWLTDRFGVTWQVAPRVLLRLIADPDPAKAGRAMQAMMGMVKFDVAEIERAAAAA